MPPDGPLLLLVDAEGRVTRGPPGHPWRGRRLWDLVAESDADAVRATLDVGAGACEVRPRLPGWGPRARLEVQSLDGPERAVRLEPSAQTAALALEEMVSVIAHEVKNPLAGISGAIEVVEAGAAEGSNEARILRAAHQRVRTLDDTLEDILLLTRPLLLEPSRIDVEGLLSRAAAGLEPDAAARVTLEIEGPERLLSIDVDLMRRALFYVVHHGLRVGDAPVDLRARPHGDGTVIEVEYAGGGLERDIGARIYDPRYLTRARRTGLHLPVAARIVREHGGDIAVEPGPHRVAQVIRLGVTGTPGSGA